MVKPKNENERWYGLRVVAHEDTKEEVMRDKEAVKLRTKLNGLKLKFIHTQEKKAKLQQEAFDLVPILSATKQMINDIEKKLIDWGYDI